jgi:hypothetical protein
MRSPSAQDLRASNRLLDLAGVRPEHLRMRKQLTRVSLSLLPALFGLALLGSCAGTAGVLSPSAPHKAVVLDVDDPELWVDETSALTQRIRPGAFFMEVLPSWNLNVPEGGGAVVELQVGRATNGSPWMYAGDWGKVPDGPRKFGCPRGRINVDIFEGHDSAFLWARLRVRTFGFEATRQELIRDLRLTFSDLREGVQPKPPTRAITKAPMDVPPRRQGEVERPLSSRICSPTSLVMVLGAMGKDVDLMDCVQRSHDKYHDLYGVWPRNVQTAWSYGVPGHLERISDWDRVIELTESGHLLIASIAAEKGVLQNAPYSATDGHLIVIRGLVSPTEVAVADPAAAAPRGSNASTPAKPSTSPGSNAAASPMCSAPQAADASLVALGV